MKCIRRQPAEAFNIMADNWLKAIKFVAERTKLIEHYGRKMGNIQSVISSI